MSTNGVYVDVTTTFNWPELGEEIARANAHDQAAVLGAFAEVLRGLGVAGTFQIDFIAAKLHTDVLDDPDAEVTLDAVKWLCRELGDRL